MWVCIWPLSFYLLFPKTKKIFKVCHTITAIVILSWHLHSTCNPVLQKDKTDTQKEKENKQWLPIQGESGPLTSRLFLLSFLQLGVQGGFVGPSLSCRQCTAPWLATWGGLQTLVEEGCWRKAVLLLAVTFTPGKGTGHRPACLCIGLSWSRPTHGAAEPVHQPCIPEYGPVQKISASSPANSAFRPNLYSPFSFVTQKGHLWWSQPSLCVMDLDYLDWRIHKACIWTRLLTTITPAKLGNLLCQIVKSKHSYS